MTELKTIAIIIPVYNEKDSLPDFLRELTLKTASLPYHFNYLVINDGSTDGVGEFLQTAVHQYPQLTVLSFSRNFGKEAAITAGLDYCQGDACIIIDADFQHPFALLDIFLTEWQNGYDIVYGSQTLRKHESYLRRILGKLFYKLIGQFSEVQLPANAGDFRLMDRKVIDAMKHLKEKNRYMKGLYCWVGFKALSVPFVAEERFSGESSWSYRKLLKLALTGIFSFTSFPLRICAYIGFSLAGIFLILTLYILIKTLIFGDDMPGYASIMTAIGLLSGIQLISIGIVGEYIAMIFNETKNRPTYIVRDIIRSDR